MIVTSLHQVSAAPILKLGRDANCCAYSWGQHGPRSITLDGEATLRPSLQSPPFGSDVNTTRLQAAHSHGRTCRAGTLPDPNGAR
jgi:hypothetical protein